MTPLPAISPDPHTCDLCGETIPSGVRHAAAPDYHAHASCQEIADVIGAPFRVTLAALPLSDLCEILQAHSADEIVRVVNLRANLTETTP